MNVTSNEHFEIVLAAAGDTDTSLIERVLGAAGYRLHRVTPDLAGLTAAAGVKPSGIVLVGLSSAASEWVLNFVEENPTPPGIVAVAESDVLAESPEWLYDVVGPDEVRSALAYRLGLALRFADMKRLAAIRTEKLGLSRTQIQMISMVDVVTGLFNRRYFEKKLAESFAGSKRYDRPLTCLVVRLENLVELQRTLGTERSNDVLDTVAEAFASVIRKADTAARIDDDLFAFLLPETPEEGAKRLVERLLERFDTTEYPHGADVHIQAGVASVHADQAVPHDLLDEALAGLAPN